MGTGSRGLPLTGNMPCVPGSMNLHQLIPITHVVAVRTNWVNLLAGWAQGLSVLGMHGGIKQPDSPSPVSLQPAGTGVYIMAWQGLSACR